MLTADLLRARMRKGQVKPQWVGHEDPAALRLAEELIATFSDHVGKTRGELVAALAENEGLSPDFKLHRGLSKVLEDGARFDATAGERAPELRAEVFLRAGEFWGSPGEDEEFPRDRFLEVVASDRGFGVAEVEAGLFADDAAHEVLSEFVACSPEELLQRYDVALAQAVLLRARKLTLRLKEKRPGRLREMVRRLRFHQLLFRAHREEDASLRLEIEGPLEVVRSSQRYGLRLALLLPTLLHLDHWELEAQIAWGKPARDVGFSLTPRQGLVSPRPLPAQWLPEGIAAFPERFSKKAKDWRIDQDVPFLDLGEQEVLLPDLIFEHRPSGFRVALEILGYWRKGAVAGRLRAFSRVQDQPVLFAISKELAAGREGLDLEDPRVLVFRKVLLPKDVLERLEALREG